MARSIDDDIKKKYPTKCARCHDESPAVRYRHWMNFLCDELEMHLLIQFGEERQQWAHREISYIRNLRDRLHDDWVKHCHKDGTQMLFGDYYADVYSRRQQTVTDMVLEMAKGITVEDAKKQLLKSSNKLEKA